MKIVITVAPNFENFELFRNELITILNLYKINFKTKIELVVTKSFYSDNAFSFDFMKKNSKWISVKNKIF